MEFGSKGWEMESRLECRWQLSRWRLFGCSSGREWLWFAAGWREGARNGFFLLFSASFSNSSGASKKLYGMLGPIKFPKPMAIESCLASLVRNEKPFGRWLVNSSKFMIIGYLLGLTSFYYILLCFSLFFSVSLEKKYGGIMPKKKPLISKDNERAYFDSADWALGKVLDDINQSTSVERDSQAMIVESGQSSDDVKVKGVER
ncbi:hypothetical protein MA16_Dca026059 [Dendrobium catenatum]|uniref:Uncharacterized protein n=1 Tax=Dendrobium catenatum TaxID=906689 RepID=A0A2I0VA76_9ASPA|nr:hypothetical protein MA16_Dca026059 [Dendrobium catenatum]